MCLTSFLVHEFGSHKVRGRQGCRDTSLVSCRFPRPRRFPAWQQDNGERTEGDLPALFSPGPHMAIAINTALCLQYRSIAPAESRANANATDNMHQHFNRRTHVRGVTRVRRPPEGTISISRLQSPPLRFEHRSRKPSPAIPSTQFTS